MLNERRKTDFTTITPLNSLKRCFVIISLLLVHPSVVNMCIHPLVCSKKQCHFKLVKVYLFKKQNSIKRNKEIDKVIRKLDHDRQINPVTTKSFGKSCTLPLTNKKMLLMIKFLSF